MKFSFQLLGIGISCLPTIWKSFKLILSPDSRKEKTEYILLTKFFHNHFRIRSMDKYPDSRIYRTVPRSTRSSPRRGTPDSSRNGSLSKPHQFLTPPDQHGGQVPGEGPYRRRSSIAIRAVKVNIIRFLLLYRCNGERAYRVKISNRARIQPLECRRPVPANDKWYICLYTCIDRFVLV